MNKPEIGSIYAQQYINPFGQKENRYGVLFSNGSKAKFPYWFAEIDIEWDEYNWQENMRPLEENPNGQALTFSAAAQLKKIGVYKDEKYTFTEGEKERPKKSLFDNILAEYDTDVLMSINLTERALWHLLILNKTAISLTMDKHLAHETDFHKAFRERYITACKDMDKAIWCLLKESDVFWKVVRTHFMDSSISAEK